MAKVRKGSKALREGSYRNITITNKQLVYERSYGKEIVIVAMNLDEKEYEIDLKTGACTAIDLLTGQKAVLKGKERLLSYSFSTLQVL